MNLSNVTNIKIPEGNVVKIVSGSDVLWEKDYSKEYFTITFDDEIGSITLINDVEWSEDKKTWNTAVANTAFTPTSKSVYIRRVGNIWKGSTNLQGIVVSTNYSLSGNIFSLLYGENFVGKTTFPSGSSYNYKNLAYYSLTLTNAENLVLPATKLTLHCYDGLFAECTNLKKPPKELPATEVENGAYSAMFYDCKNLTTIPKMHFSSTYGWACHRMFCDCTSLTNIDNCTFGDSLNKYSGFAYSWMFSGCTRLTGIIELCDTFLVDNCYTSMFSNTKITGIKVSFTNIADSTALSRWLEVTTTGVLYKPSAATYDDSALNLPSTWTVETY